MHLGYQQSKCRDRQCSFSHGSLRLLLLQRVSLRLQSGSRPLDQVIVAGLGTFQVEETGGEEWAAPRGRNVIVVFQGGRAELVVVGIGPLEEDVSACRVDERL